MKLHIANHIITNIFYIIDILKIISYTTQKLTYPAILNEVKTMIQILKGGCRTRHPSTFFMSRPEGFMHYVILITKSKGIFHIGDKEYTVAPNHAILVKPQTPYSYSNPEGNYSDDWLHFSITGSIYLKEIQSIANTPFPIDNPESLTFFIQQLLWENSYTQLEEYRNQNIDALFSVLLHHLLSAYKNREQQKKSLPFQNELQSLRLELQNSVTSKHLIKEEAKKLGISESYFQHLYTALFGISFQKDFIRMRVEYAKHLIRTSNLTLEQISEICGYASEVHFYRQFKQIAGITPAIYRNKP